MYNSTKFGISKNTEGRSPSLKILPSKILYNKILFLILNKKKN